MSRLDSPPALSSLPLNFNSLRALYRARRLTPRDLVAAVFRRIREAASAHPNIFICLLDEKSVLERADQLEQTVHNAAITPLPLFGIPFAVKDNIDVAGLPTTAACHDFSYTPATSSPVVERLLAAGAILIGKTNLDQFATGLTGLLTPFGATRNVFNPEYISGGSSSGSAVAVAAGLVSFALGTDTAGSGRVPAAFNHLVGLKPTRGILSTRGLVPACRSLDCVSFLTLNVDDAGELLTLTKGFDPHDPFSRRAANTFDTTAIKLPICTFRFGVPPASQLDFLGDAEAEALYRQSLARLEALGGRRIEIDASPFLETGRLLYEGPWIAERLASIESFHRSHGDSFHPVTHAVIERGRKPAATDAFSAQHTLETLRRRAEAEWALMDVLVLPTTSTIFTTAEALLDPSAASVKLGRYTNFVNLLDLCALAVPAGMLPAPRKVPWGITLIAPAFSEANLLALGEQFFPDNAGGLYGAARSESPPATGSHIPHALEPEQAQRTLLAVVGAHLAGQPLNYQLTELDGQLVRRTCTSPHYRLYALAGTTPPKPGLARVTAPVNHGGVPMLGASAPGVSIALEIWSLPNPAVAAFLNRVPPPLTLGNIQIDNGELVKGFLCEPCALAGATDISHYGGWLNYLQSLAMPKTLASARAD